MNRKDLEQVDVCRRYLLEKADQSRSRLMRAQIRRWIEWIDATCRCDERRSMNEETNRLRAA